jgi:diacylglycerol kinase family enzyme
MDAIIRDIHSCFDAPDSADYEIYVSRFPRAAIGKIREYAEKAGNGAIIRVYAVGGDGILFDCLNGVIGLPNAELAVIPYGNSNDFVRTFGAKKEELFRDIEAQIRSRTIPADAILCGSSYALNTCTIGIDAYMVHKAAELNARYARYWNRASSRTRKFMHNLIFFASVLISSFAFKIKNQSYTVLIDGKDASGQYAAIAISTAPCYDGGKNGAGPAMPDDSRINVELSKSVTPFNVIRFGMERINKKHNKSPPHISYIVESEITVRSENPLVLQLDGEILLDTNITVKIIPAAVRLVMAGDIPEDDTYEGRAESRE